MRLIGEIKQELLARKLAAHLFTEGIVVRVEPEGESFEIWVKDEDLLERAAEEFETFVADPDAPRYREALEKAEQLERAEHEKRRRIEKNIVHVAQKSPQSRSRPLTIMLIVICGLIAILTNFGSKSAKDGSVYRAMVFSSMSGAETSQLLNQGFEGGDNWSVELGSIAAGQIWRLVTPIFLHFDTIHLVFNMFMLYMLGSLVENRYGTTTIAILIVFCAVLSNTAQQLAPEEWGGSAVYFTGKYFMSNFGGMSGVVYGLFGFAWVRSALDPQAGFRLADSTVFILLGWLFFCMTPMAAELSVANWAHAVGLVAGMVASYAGIQMRS